MLLVSLNLLTFHVINTLTLKSEYSLHTIELEGHSTSSI